MLDKHHRVSPQNGFTRDHLVPKDRGGKGLLENQVNCCIGCNKDKSRLTVEEYRVVIAYRAGRVMKALYIFPGEKP